jgi:hypothetical protein
MSASPVALEFVRFVLNQNPHASDFTAQYDAMTRTAAARSFRNLGYRELANEGVSFSLLATGNLEALIDQVRSLEVSGRRA